MSMNNTTSNSPEDNYGIRVPLYESTVIIIVLIFALLANGLLIFLFLRDHRMRTTTNFFVISHIISEFFASCQGLIISFYVLAMNGEAVFSMNTCIFIGCENIFFFNTSFLSLTAIAVNRYLAVVKKVHHKITARKAKIVICGLWLISLMASLPWGTIFAWRPVTESRFLAWLVYCQKSPGIFDSLNDPSPSVIVNLLLNILCIGVPILVLIVCFYYILKSALRNRRQVSVSYNIHHVAADAYARSAFTTLLIITVYLICNAFILPIIISPSSAESKSNSFFYRFFIWLRSATYPMVYILRNPIYFRLLRQKIFHIYNYLVQSCSCKFKDEGNSYTTPKSPIPHSIASSRVAMEINKHRRDHDSQTLRKDSLTPAAQQIRAWYLSKPNMAFTDLGKVDGRSNGRRVGNETSKV
ncbi:adenosine receptor A3-like [Dendronephthya gigantea]|uniref:adenosine receptor A3-like n=1 Tax=Dendronephthya gigantea TaxID=151771 RepID=UPI00106DAE93|nr:adenosine receptor A3-like [Dendronephthya gigantea]